RCPGAGGALRLRIAPPPANAGDPPDPGDSADPGDPGDPGDRAVRLHDARSAGRREAGAHRADGERPELEGVDARVRRVDACVPGERADESGARLVRRAELL